LTSESRSGFSRASWTSLSAVISFVTTTRAKHAALKTA
jgi:hypothetical protein